MEAETIQSVTWEHYYRKPFRCYAEGYGMILTADGHLALYLEEQPLTEALTAALNGDAVEYHGKRLKTRYCDEAQEIMRVGMGSLLPRTFFAAVELIDHFRGDTQMGDAFMRVYNANVTALTAKIQQQKMNKI